MSVAANQRVTQVHNKALFSWDIRIYSTYEIDIRYVKQNRRLVHGVILCFMK